jgi:hypothetical protein
VTHTNDLSRVNCRLPQTPRTPSTAAAHYFDDIWTKAKKGGPRPLRRSSTTRNIGNGESNGYDDEVPAHNRTSSVGYFDEAALQEKADHDRHVAHYVSDQLERMRSNDSAAASAVGDELETGLDGTSEFEVTSR